MMATGETFSFYRQKKRSRRGKIPQVSKLSDKRTAVGQNSGELYTKKHRMIFLLCYYFNKYFEKI